MNRSYLSLSSLFGVFFLLLAFTGCSSSGLSSMTPHERVIFDKAISENKTPSEMIGQAEKRVAEAVEANLSFYAPKTLKAAKDLIDTANEKLVKKGVEPEEVILIAIQAKQTIALGFEIKEQVIDLLAISISEKKNLDDIDTQSIFPQEYAVILGLLDQMISLIEDKKPEEATGMQTGFAQKTEALLIKTLYKITLDDTRKILAEAHSKEAKRYAPMTFEAASLKLIQAETFIRTYPRDRDGIKKIGIEAFQAATHALIVTREVKIISAFKTEAIEKFVLSIEKQIHALGALLGESNIPYDTLRAQLETLITPATTMGATALKVSELETTKESLTTRLSDEHEKTASLEKQVTELMDSLEVLKNKAPEIQMTPETAPLQAEKEAALGQAQEKTPDTMIDTVPSTTTEETVSVQEITPLPPTPVTEPEVTVSIAKKE